MFSALIIDADESESGAIEEALAPYGFEFTVTPDAAEAMAQARSTTPDIILLRVELPNVSGFSVCNKLRRSDETKYIPLIMYASDVTDDVFEQHRNLKTHADDYLRIPLEPGVLLASVGGLIELAAPEQPMSDEVSDALEVELDDVLLDEGEDDDGPSMDEFEQDFAALDGATSDTIAVPPPDDPVQEDLSEETEAAFDALTLDPPDVTEDEFDASVEPREAAEALLASTSATHAAIPELPVPERTEVTDELVSGIGPGSGELSIDVANESSFAERLPERGQEDDHDGAEGHDGAGLHDHETLHSSSMDLQHEASADDDGLEIAIGGSSSRLEVHDDDDEVPKFATAESSGEFKIQRELLQLKSQLNAKQREILELRGELDVKDRNVLDAKTRNRELQAQIGDLEDKLLRTQEKIISAQEQADAASKDKSTAVRREEGLKNRLEIAQHKLKEVEEELARTQTTAAAAEERAQNIAAGLRQELEAAESERERGEAQHAKLLDELAQLRTQLVAAEERIENTLKNNRQLTDSIGQLEAELTDVKRSADQQLQEQTRQAQAHLEHQLNETKQAARAEMQRALASQAEEQQKELEFEENQHHAELEKLRNQLHEAEHNARAERDRLVRELHETRDAAQTESAALGDQLMALERKHNELAEERGRLEGELEQTRAMLHARIDAEHRAQQALAVALRVLDDQAAQ